ncbi:uncharacterized protein LY89DRAFT_691980 [Mollisia scopiformis]|uniref:Pentatricopeptide repeat domain-containing protein n=1 Tax=Mollisia scopiformis TaxID=149040 RepID=A0A132B5N9_MOLSC|nr:uncharacterized protein LY89DRAFT_691980 [Mollisia scopiformis]KUJ07204.1 hypothetical protein LY89DRAFT_691980 [Mollisia scopiformis]
MRPKLQRLLSRPSSLKLLRHLVKAPEAGRCSTPPRRFGGTAGRDGAVVQVHAKSKEEPDAQFENNHESQDKDNETQQLKSYKRNDTMVLSKQSIVEVASNKPAIESRPAAFRRLRLHNVYGQWHERAWTHAELEFESDLAVPNVVGRRTRLLDTEAHKHDMDLWGALFDYRKRIYGDEGIETFLNAVIQRGVSIPTTSTLADRFWSAFLDLGFRDPQVLDRILKYADHIWTTEKKRWSKLYTHVMSFFLINDPSEALLWHQRLFQNHPPGLTRFAEMCRFVVFQSGNLDLLKKIYMQNTHRNVYSKVVPLLCQKEDFETAMDWHFFLLENGDLPSTSRIVEPLIHYLAVYKPRSAIRVTRSLVAAGVSFASSTPQYLVDNTKISREMMNLIHGKTFSISVKKYNDNLGARWFATCWISLDIAINGVHALGVEEIGPLSLQAIALRESDPEAIKLRIEQLRDLGISIGTSLYSRAIQHFAESGHRNHLEGLLNSDQHPDELEDSKLQEELLSSFAKTGDEAQYRRTLCIQSLASHSPAIESRNLELRAQIALGDQEGIRATLNKMKDEKCPVKSHSISQLIRFTLTPRQRGSRPVTLPRVTNGRKHDDIYECVALLKEVMESSTSIPVIHWREILRRLGMLGRFNDLRSLVLFLTMWYSSGSRLPKTRHNYVPRSVSTSHPLHPLKILFNRDFQRAVVEWGFITNLRKNPSTINPRHSYVRLPDSSLPDITSGIDILKLLHHRGVHIHGPTIRKALMNRFITYYGPGRSSKLYNRLAKRRMQGKLSMVIKQLDKAFDGRHSSTVDMPRLIQVVATKRWDKIKRRKIKQLAQAPVLKALPGYKQALYDDLY